jgi:type IV secretion system protein VirD4
MDDDESRTGLSRGQRAGSAHAPGSSAPVLLLLAFALGLASWIATQHLARRLGSGPALGPWLYRAAPAAASWWRAGAVLFAGAALALALVLRTRDGPSRRWWMVVGFVGVVGAGIAATIGMQPAYSPERWLVWAVRLRRVSEGDALTQETLRLFGIAFVALLAAILAVRPRYCGRLPSTSHGSAVWGTGEGLASPTGLELGRLGATVLRYAGDGHLITVAPTRTGKGVSAVIPNLLHYPGSVVVTDPKGENYSVTARQRRALGSSVHALDPFGVVGGTAAYNPLDLIDASAAEANDDAWMLADMLVVTDVRANDEAFWTEEARALLAGLILHTAASPRPELRTLTQMRSSLTLPPDQFQLLLREMLVSDAAGGLVARAAARLLQKADRERSGVVSSAQSYTHFLDSPRMAQVLSRSSFALSDVKRGHVSLYLVLPPERMDSYRGWLRVMTACTLAAMMRLSEPPPERVLFLLDEFANLGRMRPVERAISLAAGYGASFWLLLQDLAQLKGTYAERWQTFLANADVLQIFGINDWETADYVSKMTGDATIRVESENVSTGVSRGRSSSRQQSAAQTTSETGRRLLLPDEVRRMSGSEQLLFVRGRAPVRAERLNYLRDGEYATLFDANPLHSP